jgi:hypothetical protein
VKGASSTKLGKNIFIYLLSYRYNNYNFVFFISFPQQLLNVLFILLNNRKKKKNTKLPLLLFYSPFSCAHNSEQKNMKKKFLKLSLYLFHCIRFHLYIPLLLLKLNKKREEKFIHIKYIMKNHCRKY